MVDEGNVNIEQRWN